MEKPAIRILIVDDTPQNIDILHGMLSQKGYSVSGVPSGEIALKVVKQFLPDVILLDVMMPGLNGFDTCRKLKADPVTQAIPIIFITAKSDARDIAEGFNAGGADYILKPAKEEEVWARVGHQVEIRRLFASKNRLIKRLNQMEKRNKEIINRATDPIIVVSSGGTIESANPAALHMLQYSHTEFIGQHFVDFIEEKYRNHYAQCFEESSLEVVEKLASIDASPQEVQVIKKDGSHVQVDLSVSQIGYDSPKFLCLLHDLTVHHNLVLELRRLTLIDKLTGLANRRRLDEFYSKEWFRCQRNHEWISVLFIDIDHFKEYNDHYGHQQGDSCLQQIGNVLKKCVLRPADLVARYGGEEFVVVLPETNFQGALELAEKIRKNVESLAQEHIESKVSNVVTVSIGISSCIPVEDIKLSQLLEQADLALYDAKAEGRNRSKARTLRSFQSADKE